MHHHNTRRGELCYCQECKSIRGSYAAQQILYIIGFFLAWPLATYVYGVDAFLLFLAIFLTSLFIRRLTKRWR